jgi:hypothetical protein
MRSSLQGCVAMPFTLTLQFHSNCHAPYGKGMSSKSVLARDFSSPFHIPVVSRLHKPCRSGDCKPFTFASRSGDSKNFTLYRYRVDSFPLLFLRFECPQKPCQLQASNGECKPTSLSVGWGLRKEGFKGRKP